MAHCCSLTNILELSLPSFKVREEASIFLVPFFTVYFVLTYAELSMYASRYGSHNEQVYLQLTVPPFCLGWDSHKTTPPTLLFLSAKGFFISIHSSPLEFALLNAVELVEVGGG